MSGATFETLSQLDVELARAGHHPLTPFWREQAERFYAHPTARTLVARVGRGGAKSHTSAKIALNGVLFGDWRIGPGERHYWAFVSRTKDEAQQRLLLLESFLRALGIGFETRGDEIALRDAPRGFRVFACSIGAVSGFRCFGFTADELAKWNIEGVNPGLEVIASLTAMCITHPGAPRLLISSPVGFTDPHATRYERGDTTDQITAYAPSWVANPAGITEAQTREAEPDDRVWRREYAAIPQLAELAAFPVDDVDRAFLSRVPPFTPAQKVLLLDPSSGGLSSRDRFSWAIASWCIDERGRWACDGDGRPYAGPVDGKFEINGWTPSGPPYLALHEVGAFEGGFAGSLTGDEIADELARIARRHEVKIAHSDQRESLFLSTALQRRSIKLHCHAWSSPSKSQAVQLVRRWLADRTLSLPPSATELRKELLSFEEVITASGALTFGGRRAHDDFVALLVTLAHAELNPETRLPKSNLGQQFRYGRANY